MFTGIVESVGRIRAAEKLRNGMRLAVECGRDLKLHSGDSLAVDGVCLTCARVGGRRVQFVLSSETLERSRFGVLRAGDRVNLERALAANARLGGHFLQGHVDGLGSVAAMDEDPPGWTLSLDLGPDLAAYCVEKGSIGVNGVSLTIARIRDRRIWIALIPYTWKHTALSRLKPSDPVNIETDILAKYVRKFLHPGQQRSESEAVLWKFVKASEAGAE
ncbi:MAG: riboflavin synthase [Acidobacteria bacterium]|nr:riboflavin synthase [Acidobacteriota bacterium]